MSSSGRQNIRFARHGERSVAIQVALCLDYPRAITGAREDENLGIKDKILSRTQVNSKEKKE